MAVRQGLLCEKFHKVESKKRLRRKPLNRIYIAAGRLGIRFWLKRGVMPPEGLSRRLLGARGVNDGRAAGINHMGIAAYAWWGRCRPETAEYRMNVEIPEKAGHALHKPNDAKGRSADERERRVDAAGVVVPRCRSSIRTKGRMRRRCHIGATLSDSLTLP